MTFVSKILDFRFHCVSETDGSNISKKHITRLLGGAWTKRMVLEDNIVVRTLHEPCKPWELEIVGVWEIESTTNWYQIDKNVQTFWNEWFDKLSLNMKPQTTLDPTPGFLSSLLTSD